MNSNLYCRPDKPKRMVVKSRKGGEVATLPPLQTIPEIHYSSECHVTPPEVAARMVEYLGSYPQKQTLEPSAGTGALVNALLEQGHSKQELVVVELNVELNGRLGASFGRDITHIRGCFLEWAGQVGARGQFAQIIMNPPFKNVKKHIAAALGLLGPGGHEYACLVALVPVAFSVPHSAGYESEELETLGSDTFAHAKVNTKIVRITKYK